MYLCSSPSGGVLKKKDINKKKEEREVRMEEMVGSIENHRNVVTVPMDTALPTWKLYDNPHFADRLHNSPHLHHPYNCLSKSRSALHTRDSTTFFRPMEYLSDLDVAREQIKELRAELEFERRMRRKVESLNKALTRELADERRGREAAADTCKQLAEEITCMREEADRAVREMEEERRMLRIAEVWREERVQMKLSEARILMEEKLRELTSSGCKPELRKEREEVVSLKVNAQSPGGEETSRDGQQRREVENPHIKRGIKGMEFPRAVRVRASGMGSSPSSSREGRGHLGSNLECQRAQLRVLMRHRNPVGSGLMGTTENLVM